MARYIYDPKPGYATPGYVPGQPYEGDFSQSENFRLLEETPKTKRVKTQSGSVVEVPTVRDGETITILE